MQTHFSSEQRKQPTLREAEGILRKCVHCGFCTATCPTFALLGDELDSPRGRIYLIKDMLENNRPADAHTAKHIDRCLSCLSCATTCPSGVDYMRLIDTARQHVETTWKRPLTERFIRMCLAKTLPYPKRFRLALMLATPLRLARPLLTKLPNALKPLAAMATLAPKKLPAKSMTSRGGNFTSTSPVGKKVILMNGCVQPTLNPAINDATVQLLNRLGVDVIIPPQEGCCGALTHHMGKTDEARAHARHTLLNWKQLIESEEIDAILVTASGCGTMVKDYAHFFHDDAELAAIAQKIAGLCRDISEYLTTLSFPEPTIKLDNMPIAYHSACSMQHGQKIIHAPQQLLQNAGFELRPIAEGHLCCGSAGSYNITQPELASRLRERKIANIVKTKATLVATGNIGCMMQLASDLPMPIMHTIELLDWVYGGKKPQSLQGEKQWDH